MPMLETPPELADAIADLCGVYGSHDDNGPEHCSCRVCFVAEMEQRIRQAVENEGRLTGKRRGDSCA